MARSNFGHIEKQSNGRYRVYWRNGNQRHSKRVATKEDAVNLLARVRLQDGNIDFKINYTDFYKGVIIPSYKNLSERTIAEYKYSWNDLCPYIGKRAVADTNWRMVQNIINKFDAPSRQRKILRFWRRMLTFAIRDNILLTNPCMQGIQLKRNNVKLKTLYTKDEVCNVLNQLYGTKFAIPVLLECCTGIRHEEFCGLNKSDFDFRDGEHAFIEINKAVTDVCGRKVLKDTKTEYSKRIVALDGDLSLYLNQHKHLMTEKKTISDYKSPAVYTRQWKRYCEENNLKYVTFGNMRSVYATLCSEAGCIDSLVSMTMGHSGTTTKEKNYQNASLMAIKLNAEMLADYINFRLNKK